MIDTLTSAQLNLLRRCDGGLRVFESGPALATLLVDVHALVRLMLVQLDEDRGYELTAAGEALLVRVDARARGPVP